MRMGVYEGAGSGQIEASSPQAGRVGVTRLALTDFRNYRSTRLDLDLGPVLLTGPNGSDKPNLLEAVSYLSPGRGLRGARLGELDRHKRNDATSSAGWA